MVKKLNIVYLFMDAWLSGQSNRLITGRSWVRIPERPLLFLQNKYICERLPVETEFIFSTQPAQRRRRAKPGMRLAAALASNRSVLGSNPRASTLFFGVTGRSIFCTTTLYNFCIPLLFPSVYCSVCCSCFIIYKKQQ